MKTKGLGLDPSRGGIARAKKLSASERREIAVKAAESRWGTIPKATHSGSLRIGELELDCAVLEDGTRVLTETRFMEALGMYRSGALSVRREQTASGARMPLYLAYKNIKPFVDKHLGDVHTTPLKYRTPAGNIAFGGIPAEIIPKICEVWLDARAAGVLGRRQEQIAERADVLLRGLARVGIIALVDEATGYQDDRARDALTRLLEQFITEELRPWVKTFPAEYYRGIYRLRGWDWPPKSRTHNSNLGKYTNDLVYDRLAPGVKEELHRVTPRNERGRLKHTLHQHLTETVGHPKLREHLGSVVMALRMSKSWDDFMDTMNRFLPKWPKYPVLPFGPDDEK